MNVPKELRAEVLAALYNNSKPLGMGILQFTTKNMTIEQAENLLNAEDPNKDIHFDYLEGRVMKISFRVDTDDVQTWLYNRDNGEGAAEKVIIEMLKKYEGAKG